MERTRQTTAVRLAWYRGEILVVMTMCLALVPSRTHGGFRVHERETFDGTKLDREHWEVQTYSVPDPVVQDDGLIFEDMAECVTTQVTVGVGDIVSVQLLEHPMGDAQSSLFLTTKSRESALPVVEWDSHFAHLTYGYVAAHKDYGFIAGSGGGGKSSGTIYGLATHPPLAGEPLTFQIERLAENRFVMSAYDSNMTLVGETHTAWMLDLEPDAKFYISLVARPRDGGRVVFDNVTIVRASAKADAPIFLNTLDEWYGDATHAFGETPVEDGRKDTIGTTFGQTFRIAEDGWFRLDSIAFEIDDYAPGVAPEPCQFEVYVMPWTGTRPIGQTVYASGPLTTTAAWRFEPFTLAPKEVLLAGQTTYVVLFTANGFLNGTRSDAAVASVADFYPGGGLYIHHGGTFDDLFTEDWSTEFVWTTDLALKLEWSAWSDASSQ